MNNLEKDFKNFMNHRLIHVEAKMPVMHNEAAIALNESLNHEQSHLLMKAMDYSTNRSSILEEESYQQGLIDAFAIMAMLKENL